MKSNSDKYPTLLTKSAGLTQVAYDIIEVTRENPNGTTRTSYDYEYVAIDGEVTRDKIIDAIIKEEIGGKDAELALINNEIASAGTEEYAGYQAWRLKAKNIADEVLVL